MSWSKLLEMQTNLIPLSPEWMVGLGDEGLRMTPFTFDFLCVTVNVKWQQSAVFPPLLSV